jgi:hypothetical protein
MVMRLNIAIIIGCDDGNALARHALPNELAIRDLRTSRTGGEGGLSGEADVRNNRLPTVNAGVAWAGHRLWWGETKVLVG